MDFSRQHEHPESLHWIIRRHKAAELGQIVSENRVTPGFERFQLPALLNDIQLALRQRQAFAVTVVLSALRCDVMILGEDTLDSDTWHFRLPALNLDRIRHMVQGFSTSCSVARTAQSNPRKFLKTTPKLTCPNDQISVMCFLSDLWVTLVRPIIEHIRSKTTTSNPGTCKRKRLWWCPTGALSSLPLHAVGVYDGPSQDHIGNYVVFSYTPTISALYRQLTKTWPQVTEGTVPKMLLVAEPSTVGLPSLVNARVEVDNIKAVILVEYTKGVNVDEGILVGQALDGLREAQILHLACHGHQDQESPLNSGFDLQDGRLTLAKLMRLNTPNAQLAYLSACDSAGIDESRPDEGLNLEGTMIFVGFKSAVGTMWAMDDLDGPFMAQRIYARIFKNGQLDLSAVPYAVDEAICQLRESGVPASRWATYVHFSV